jgi:hypothetical protein
VRDREGHFRRQVGDARHVGENDHRTVVETDTLFARSLEWRAWHRVGYVAGSGGCGKPAIIAGPGMASDDLPVRLE